MTRSTPPGSTTQPGSTKRSPGPRPPAPPRLSGALAALGQVPEPDALVEDADLSGADWTDAQLEGADLMSVSGRSVRAPRSVWRRSQCADLELASCDLAGSSWPEGGWRRVRLTDCRLTGVELSSCVLEDVDFSGCVLEMARFRFATLRRVRFTGCRLTGADFSDSRLEEVVLDDCVLDSAVFDQVRIQGRRTTGNRRQGPGLVISGGSIEGLSGADQLRGAAIDPLHLEILGALLAGAAGIFLELPDR
ncbi:secreted effector protein PipB2 [Acidipropionibacterium jensenii]|uniref:Secreted effector protein PipB2 n=1 Tax=Acidipropionibacterium jensenii TaxID=1749 RepID=A0A448NVW3_9ACTN|nr:pentapeptide repeat-containing protein [Acidipropionibacterium jensenii]VEI02122.1 secreted effector protein PipB2 [Acidipropionibacterium jensenii]